LELVLNTSGIFINTANSLAPTDNLNCTLCGKEFKTRRNLSVHLQFHAGEKPHMCIVCSKTFTTKSDLKRHGKVHSTEKVKQFKVSLFFARNTYFGLREMLTLSNRLKV